jgi:SAM-dependent methyltransferase
MSIFNGIKNFLLTHEPFKPAHMGNWIRERYFYYYLKRYAPTNQVKDVLDGGCGQGRFARKVAFMFPDARILAVDIKMFPAWLENSPSNVEFREMDLTQYSEVGMRDLIYSVDVLEHIRGNRIVLEKFFAALRPGGVLYLAVPCEDAERFYFPREWFKEFNEWAADEHVGEMRPLQELVVLMREIGFSVLLARPTFTCFGHLAWEIETLLHYRPQWKRINLLLMPLYKILGWLDVLFPSGGGNNLIIAKRL